LRIKLCRAGWFDWSNQPASNNTSIEERDSTKLFPNPRLIWLYCFAEQFFVKAKDPGGGKNFVKAKFGKRRGETKIHV
jgi:hypothetical protein